MARDFIEERRWQRLREMVDKLMSPEIRAVYEQHPLLRFLLNAPPKDLVDYRRRFLAEQEAAGNILPPKKIRKKKSENATQNGDAK